MAIIVCFAFLAILKGPTKNTQTAVEPTGAGIIIFPPAVLGPPPFVRRGTPFSPASKRAPYRATGLPQRKNAQAYAQPGSFGQSTASAAARRAPRRLGEIRSPKIVLPADNAAARELPSQRTRQPPSCVGPTFVGHVTSGLRSDRRPRASTA